MIFSLSQQVLKDKTFDCKADVFFLSAVSHHPSIHISIEHDSWNNLLKAQLSFFVFSSTDRIKSLLMQSVKHFNVTNIAWGVGVGASKSCNNFTTLPSSKFQEFQIFFLRASAFWIYTSMATHHHHHKVVMVDHEWILTLVNYRWLNHKSNWVCLWLILIQIECC